MDKQSIILTLLIIASISVPILSILKDNISNKEQANKHIELIEKLSATEMVVANTKAELAELKISAIDKLDKSLQYLLVQHKLTPEAVKEIKHAYVEAVGVELKVETGVADVKVESNQRNR